MYISFQDTMHFLDASWIIGFAGKKYNDSMLWLVSLVFIFWINEISIILTALHQIS